MRVCLLGSGAADGWPNAFCACASCDSARSANLIRGQTSALIDDALVVDCGPQAPFQASRIGESLAGVQALLFTHAHSDHFGPEALLYRSWVHDKPLQVLGPASLIEACKPWLAPSGPVELIPVSAGDVVEVAGYEIRVLAAEHTVFEPGDCVLFDIREPNGARMLWASDTGPLPETWYAHVAEARYEVVYLERTSGERDLGNTHLNAATFANTVDALRRCRAIDELSTIVAVHLGHDNGDETILRRELAASDAIAGTDGYIVFAGVS